MEFTIAGSNPIELEHLVTIFIMSKSWCEKNRATKPQNYSQKEDMITAHQANGTGAYALKLREPDIKTVLTKNPNWWGIKQGLFTGNADEVVYLPIVSDGTRLAALLSGEVDLVNDPPPQDVPRLKRNPDIKVLEGTENRIVFIGMDQHRDELLYSSVKGKNPFKDKRVRQALYQAIDIDAIKSTTMRGLSQPSGALLLSPVQIDARTRAAIASTTGRRPSSFSPTRDTAAVSTSRSTARTTAMSTTKKFAWRWPPCGRRSASTSASTRCRAPTIFPSLRTPIPACTCSAGAAVRPTASSSCNPCSRRTLARATATTTTAAIPTPSSTS